MNASWQTALVVTILAALAGWLIACAIVSIYRAWRHNRRVIRQKPAPDPRRDSYRNFERDWK